MTQFARRLVLPAALAAAFAVAPALAAAQDREAERQKAAAKPAAGKADMPEMHAEGVILKVEPIQPGASEGSTVDRLAKEGKEVARGHRVTLNTAVVWRDFARDTSVSGKGNDVEKVAEKGANSVATKGQPKAAETTVLIDIPPGTAIESRFRSIDDETNVGSRTVAQAERKAGDANADQAKGKGRQAARPISLKVEDLKPGLWVAADYHQARAHNHASRVVVLKPINAGEAEAAEAPKPKAK